MTQAYILPNYVEQLYVGTEPFLAPPEYYKNTQYWTRCGYVSPDTTPVYCVSNTEDFYSFVEPWAPAYSVDYYAVGYADTDSNIYVHNRLQPINLRDAVSGWINKFNTAVGVMNNFNYLQTTDDVGFNPERKPWKLLLEPTVVETRFGPRNYETDKVVQYVGNGQWEDLGLVDTDPIELFRVGRWQRKDPTDVANLRAIAPVLEDWYQDLTDVAIHEF